MPFYAYLPYFALFVTAANLVFALRFRRMPGAPAFLGILAATGLYLLGQGIELGQRDLAGAIFWDNVQFLPADLAPIFGLFFVLTYAFPGRRFRVLAAVLLILPIANFGVVWLGSPELLRTEARILSGGEILYLSYQYGWWMWLTIAHAYLLMLFAVGILIYRFVFAGRLSRGQIGTVLIGMLVPWVGTILTVTGNVPFTHPGLDITPITFTFMNVVLSIALFRFRLLDIVPVAREHVFEVMADGVLVISLPDGSLIDWNPAARSMLEPFARGRWAGGTILYDLIPELANSAPGSAVVRELDIVRDTRQISIFVSSSTIKRSPGTQGLVFTVQDVTELRAARRELEAQKARAEEASEAKSRFLANASHEIRTPMNAILGVADLLNDTKLDEDQRSLIRVFQTAGRTLLHMLNDLLDISRIEAGKIELQLEDFDLRQLLADVVRTFQLSGGSDGVTLNLDFAAETPGRIHGDPQRLTQVLANLLSNALKNTTTGEINVRVRSLASVIDPGARKQDRLEFVVEDTGTGIPVEFLDRLFEPFQQGNELGKRPRPGAGLGLTISRQLVALLGGEISASNRPEGGARFVFDIRYDPAAAVEQSAHPSAQAPGDGSPVDLSDLRILVAEDVEENRMLIERFLLKTRAGIDFAHDGQAALEAFERERFGLVLLDVQMPIMGGYDAAAAMRRFEKQAGRPRTPIIALTAFALEEERERAMESGMDDHLSKPVSRAALVAMIEKHGRP